MEAVAKMKNIRISARKLRLVVDVARGKKVQRAIDDLSFSKNTMAGDVVKLIKSAVNNASQQRGVNVDNLVVKTIFVDVGPTMKRFMTRARGSSSKILKRTSQMTVIVDEAQVSDKKSKKTTIKNRSEKGAK